MPWTEVVIEYLLSEKSKILNLTLNFERIRIFTNTLNLDILLWVKKDPQ